MLVQQIYPQLVRPPVPVRGAAAGPVAERAFFFRCCIHFVLLLLDEAGVEARDAGSTNFRKARLFVRESEIKSIVSIVTIDDINHVQWRSNCMSTFRNRPY